MIINDRQLRASERALERFQAALDEGFASEGIHPRLQAAQREAVESQIADLRAEVDEYLSLKSGQRRVIEVEQTSELPVALIKARIASGLTQKDLADRLGLKEQQIQRYEAQRYEGASLTRVHEVATALGVRISHHIELPSSLSYEGLLRKAQEAGLPASLVKTRIAPDRDVGIAFERLGFLFDWNSDALASGEIGTPALAGQSARFKMPRNRNARAVAAYTAYAYRLAEICAEAMADASGEAIPIDSADMLRLLKRQGGVTFRNALSVAWDLGVIVLPLADVGQFHGACWRFNGKNVIVLKQGDRSLDRWLVDLLHELFHAGRFPEDTDFEVVEEAETSETRRTDPEELHATWFASLVATEGRAEELFLQSINESGGDLRRLKSAVVRSANASGVAPGALANFVAHRLAMQGSDWWGAASNLQDRSEDALEIARDMFFERFDFSQLSPLAAELLQLALTDEVSNG